MPSEVLGDIEGFGADGLTGLGQGVHARELPLEVGPLLFGQPLAELVEPAVDHVCGDVLFDNPALIQQRHHGAVGNGLVYRVGVDKPAEGGQGILLLLQQRRAGETEIAGVRQNTPHLHGELPVSAILAGLATVALVHQHEDIRVRVGC